MEREWLKRQVAPSELNAIEDAHMWKVRSDARITVLNDKLPFGKHYLDWREMRAMCENDNPHDVLWEFDSGGWDRLAGRKGYCITRGLTTGWVIITQMN